MERRTRIQVVADAVNFLGEPTKSGEPDGGIADDGAAQRPEWGHYPVAALSFLIVSD